MAQRHRQGWKVNVHRVLLLGTAAFNNSLFWYTTIISSLYFNGLCLLKKLVSTCEGSLADSELCSLFCHFSKSLFHTIKNEQAIFPLYSRSVTPLSSVRGLRTLFSSEV